MLLYEIADDALVNVDSCQAQKKSVLCAQGSFVRSLMLPMSKQRILAYTSSISTASRQKKPSVASDIRDYVR